MPIVKVKSLRQNTLLSSPMKAHPEKSLPPPSGEALPGLDWLGYGYKPFGLLMDGGFASEECLFAFPSWRNVDFNGRRYSAPATVNTLASAGPSTFKRLDHLEISEMTQKISAEFGGSGGWGLFSGEFNYAFSESFSKHWEYLSSVIQVRRPRLRLNLVGPMREYLKPALRQELDQAVSAAGSGKPFNYDQFFKRFGTHYINALMLGGLYNMYMTFSKRSYASALAIDAKANAAFAAFKGEDQEHLAQTLSEIELYGEVTVTAYGGSAAPLDALNQGLTTWESAVDADPQPFPFPSTDDASVSGLVPIYELAADVAGKAALKVKWAEYCKAHSLVLPDMGPALTSLRVGSNKDNHAAKVQAEAGGHTRTAGDLNDDVGGNFIYLGKRLTVPDSGHPAIMNLKAVWADSSSVSAPAGYTRIDADLNKGASGEYIYLCWTTSSTGIETVLPIRDVTVEIYEDRKPKSFYTEKGLEAVTDPHGDIMDFNKGAGGKFIYVVMRR